MGGVQREREYGAIARSIIDSNLYVALGTSDAEGRPWVSPVYYASAGYTEFFWASSPEATHSRNIAVRQEISMVIFDSQAAIHTGQAVYMSAVAEELFDEALDRGAGIYPGPAERGARTMTVEQLQPPALHRLYRAIVSQHSILDPEGHPVHGRKIDHRTPVAL